LEEGVLLKELPVLESRPNMPVPDEGSYLRLIDLSVEDDSAERTCLPTRHPNHHNLPMDAQEENARERER